VEIGLYQLKYPFRKLLDGLLPVCKHTNPNTISLLLLPLGILTAIIYYFAPKIPYFYCLGIVLIFLRMVIGTLDGLVAETYHKQTPNGTILNRLTPEIADWMLLLSIVLINDQHPILNYSALLVGWV
jgi:phosphatidylglycerophosphate synthase